MTSPHSANSVPPPPTGRTAEPEQHPPVNTPDGRYLVVRGRLWRRSNPSLSDGDRAAQVRALMDARRAVREALRTRDGDAERDARAAVHAAKVALGERGPVWWDDGAPDYTRHLVRNTPYAAWWATQASTANPQAAGDALPAPQS